MLKPDETNSSEINPLELNEDYIGRILEVAPDADVAGDQAVVIIERNQQAEPASVAVEGAPITASSFDPAALMARIGDDATVLGEFVQILLSETSRLVAACREAAQLCDGEALSRAAHSLKGILMNLEAGQGPGQAIELARRLEQYGQNEHIRDALPIVEVLDSQFQWIAAGFRSYLTAL